MSDEDVLCKARAAEREIAWCMELLNEAAIAPTRDDDAMRGLLTKATREYARGYPVVASGANVAVRDVNFGFKVGDSVAFTTPDGQNLNCVVSEVYDPEADMDNANEPYKPTENESFLAGVLGIDYRLYSIGAVDLYFVAACEILRLRGALRLDIMPASDKPAPNLEPVTPPHRAPEVWARIRSLNAI